MRRRSFLQTLAASSASAFAAPRLPNIIYVLADDLGWGDLRCYNPDSAIPTPHADRLASQGVRFTDMHSPSSVCTPTRYGILTGRYCWRTQLKKGVLWGYSPNLIEPGRLTVPGMLKRQGYYTAGVGKWHLGLGNAEKVDYAKPLKPGPCDHGFDYYFGIPASLDMDPYLYFENDRTVEQPTSETPGQDKPRGVFWRKGPIAPGFDIEQVLPTLTSKAETIIRERAGKAQPLFLYLPLTGPHTPWMPLKQNQGRSKAGIYGDFVTQVDDTLGRILKAVDDAGAASNTLVIFTSDNGADWKEEDKAKFAHRSNANWRGEKADVWDGGHRVPFLARWPGQVPKGSVSSQLGCLTDLMGTSAAISGFSLPRDAGEDSFNLLPAYRGTARRPIRDAIVHHSSEGVFCIREGSWKLVLGLGSGGFSVPKFIKPTPGGPQGQLYNLKDDPGETTNLWLEKPEMVRKLSALLERYQNQGYSRAM
jgi:arylsulfatase A